MDEGWSIDNLNTCLRLYYWLTIGSWDSSRVLGCFPSQGIQLHPGAGRPTTPVGSYLVFRPLLLLRKLLKGLWSGVWTIWLLEWLSAGWVHVVMAALLPGESGDAQHGCCQSALVSQAGPVDGEAHWALELPWLLLVTEMSQNYIPEIFVSCLQLSIFISLLILEMTTRHCSQTPRSPLPNRLWSLDRLHWVLFVLPPNWPHAAKATCLSQPRQDLDWIMPIGLKLWKDIIKCSLTRY